MDEKIQYGSSLCWEVCLWQHQRAVFITGWHNKQETRYIPRRGGPGARVSGAPRWRSPVSREPCLRPFWSLFLWGRTHCNSFLLIGKMLLVVNNVFDYPSGQICPSKLCTRQNCFSFRGKDRTLAWLQKYVRHGNGCNSYRGFSVCP